MFCKEHHNTFSGRNEDIYYVPCCPGQNYEFKNPASLTLQDNRVISSRIFASRLQPAPKSICPDYLVVVQRSTFNLPVLLLDGPQLPQLISYMFDI